MTLEQIRQNRAEAQKQSKLGVAECEKRKANKEIATETERRRCLNQAWLSHIEGANQGINAEIVSVVYQVHKDSASRLE